MMRRSACLSALAGLARAAASSDAGCAASGTCKAQDLARDSVLLQAKHGVLSAEVAQKEFSEQVPGAHPGDGGVQADWLWRRQPESQPEDGEEDDWMLELSLDHDWVAGGGLDDLDFGALSAAEQAEFTAAAHHEADDILAEGGDEALGEREAWEHEFATEHRKAVHALQRNPELSRTQAPPCVRLEGAGDVAGIYTFGAPATALSPLENPRSLDGKFPGLRIVTQRKEVVWRRLTRTYSDPVPFMAGLVGLRHPHMDLLLMPMNVTPEFFNASTRTSRRPRSDMAFWVRGHYQDIYTDQILLNQESFLEANLSLAYTMLVMSRAVYPEFNNYTQEGAAEHAGLAGWNLVATSKNEQLHARDIVFQDNTSLFQDPATQACALAFVGTHHVTQWLVNLKFRTAPFCGIPHVHIGFRNQVRRAIRSSQWKNVMTGLESCSELYLTGHSLGAGQAQLVAACMQRAPAKGEDGWDDYRYLVWRPDAAKVKTLPPIA